MTKKPQESGPSGLSPESKKLYAKLRREWTLDDQAGRFLLMRALECYDEMRHAQDVLRRDGEMVTDRWGQKKLHPMCQRLKESRAHLLQCLKSLDLDLESLKK